MLNGKLHIVKSLHLWCFTCALLFAQFGYSQTNVDTTSTDTTRATNIQPSVIKKKKKLSFNGFSKKVEAKFKHEEVIIEQGEVASNVLKIQNTSDKKATFYIQMAYPDGWRSLSLVGRPMELEPNDSIFVPCTVIPRGIINGNTKFFIQAIVFDDKGFQQGNAKYFVSTKKKVSWELNVEPKSNIYFKNDEETVAFSYNIYNSGNFDQEILASYKGFRNDIQILDTLNNPVVKSTKQVTLAPHQDTTFSYRVKHLQAKRNYKKIDADNHKPNHNNETKKFSLMVRTEESKSSTTSLRYKKNKRVNFIRLPNNLKLNGTGGNELPITAEANINNLFREFTTMNLNLRGIKYFSRDKKIVYSANALYSTNYLNSRFLENGQAYLGYFFKKGNVQLGSIGAGYPGLIGAGRGIKGEYRILPKHTLGAFLVRGPQLFSGQGILSYGVSHNMTYLNNYKLETYVGRSDNQISNLNSNVIGSSTAITLAKKYNISAGLSLNYLDGNSAIIPTENSFGYMARLGVSSSFFKKNFRTGIQGSYTSPSFGLSLSERFIINSNNSLLLKNNWSLNLNSSFFEYKNKNGGSNNITYAINGLNNILTVSNPDKLGRFKPGLYYNIQNQVISNLHKRGLSLNYGKFSLKNNFRYAVNLIAGYTKDYAKPEIDDYFSVQSSVLLNYRNVSINTFYNYGPNSPSSQELMIQTGRTPQLVRASLSHQHLFANPHFMVETNVNYSYYNVFNQHSLGLYPNFYIFTDNGFRFKAMFGYNMSTSNYSVVSPEFANTTANDNTTTRNTNYNFGLSIRKTFNVPIPGMKSTSTNQKVVAFLDLNGNDTLDLNEVELENVVVRLGDNEVITNREGKAEITNLQAGSYPLVSFSLDPLKGWFPKNIDSLDVNTSGTIYVPFIRGIKVDGAIVVNREKLIEKTQKALDLTDIKVTAEKENGQKYEVLTGLDGSFQIFLPYGNYKLSIDEGILGSRYNLLENNIELELDNTLENIYVTFYILQKQRKIKIKKF